jgi:hypothetical protein
VLLDPLLRQMSAQQLPIANLFPPATQAQATALPVPGDLQHLLNGLARRVAWGGDRRRGSARIEVSQGALAGATLIVHAEERAVSVELQLPPGVGAQGVQERIVERLEARGFAARVRIE